MAERIQEGFDVFVHDGEKAVGAVREVRPTAIVVYVENKGDFLVPMGAVQAVHDEKVVLNSGKIDLDLRRAIGHIHDAEDPTI